MTEYPSPRAVLAPVLDLTEIARELWAAVFAPCGTFVVIGALELAAGVIVGEQFIVALGGAAMIVGALPLLAIAGLAVAARRMS